MSQTSSREFEAVQRDLVRHQLERQAAVFTVMLSGALAMDAWRLHPSAEFALILRRLPIQIAICALVFLLLRYTPFGSRRPVWLGTLGYATVAGFGGRLLGDLGGFDGPFFYAAYVLPTFTMMLSCQLSERLLLTGSMVAAFALAFFLPHPEHLDYRFAHIAFSYLAVIIAVDVYFGHRSTLVLEERFRVERLLDRDGQALAAHNHELEERVRSQAASVSSLLDRLETTRDRTRTELARDLHDGMAQLVVGTRLELHQIDRALSTGQTLSAEDLGYLRGLVDGLDRQVREVVRGLREPGVSGSLEGALEKLQAAYGRMPGLSVGVHLVLEEEPSDAHREVIVGVAREALTNAAKHARAGRVDVHVDVASGEVRLRVDDDGEGIADGSPIAGPSGFGLLGMRERVESAGGAFGVESLRTGDVNGRGTRVWARLPTRAETPETAS